MTFSIQPVPSLHGVHWKNQMTKYMSTYCSTSEIITIHLGGGTATITTSLHLFFLFNMDVSIFKNGFNKSTSQMLLSLCNKVTLIYISEVHAWIHCINMDFWSPARLCLHSTKSVSVLPCREPYHYNKMVYFRIQAMFYYILGESTIFKGYSVTWATFFDTNS